MPSTKSKTTDPVTAGIKTIATKQCPSLSGTSTITYKLGRDDEGTLWIRLHDASGGGFLNSGFFKAEDFAALLRKHSDEESFTSMILAPFFRDRSENSRGFMSAVLRAEGALVPYKNTRKLRVGDIDAFLQQTTPTAPKRRKPTAKASRAKATTTPARKSKASPAK